MDAEINADVLRGMIHELETMGLDESPRMKCLKKCQREHLECLASAGTDPNKKTECNKALARCVSGCPPLG